MEAPDFPGRPLADKFLHGAIAPANAYRHTKKFQLPSSNSFRDKEGVPKFNVGLLPFCRTPYPETFTYAPSTWQGKTASQISVRKKDGSPCNSHEELLSSVAQSNLSVTRVLRFLLIY